MIEKDDNVYSFHALHSPLSKPIVCAFKLGGQLGKKLLTNISMQKNVC